jgi:hypothetical protein
MEKPLALSMWIAVALYAVCGLFGIVVFHDALPNTQQMTDGYGVNYRTTAALPTRNAALPILKISSE